ncbi:MAG TPA: LytTR family DNA-binding domain-containing protein [Paludibacter sp.]|nr:LytTR family DNA-binding domain-containing protein [Paludibacter sp.]
MIKVLIIEDEQPAAKRLERMLLDISSDFEIIERCDSIESSVQYLKTGIMPDLVLLDIQLGDGLSFEIFKQVEISCPVIFTTAFDEFAIKAFELNSIDYLLKPINHDKLEKSIAKFRKINQQTVQNDWKVLTSLLEKEKREYKQRFLVNVGEHLHSVQTQDIAYFYSIEKSSFLVAKNGKSYALDLSLDKLETVLSPTDFFRISRQYLIAFSAIKKISILSKSRIKLLLEPAPTNEILVSTARTHDFREWLDR